MPSLERADKLNGPDEGIRTPNPQFRRLMLYPLSYVRVGHGLYPPTPCVAKTAGG